MGEGDRCRAAVEWVIYQKFERCAFHPFRQASPDTFPIEGKDLLDDIFSAPSVLDFVQSTSARKRGRKEPPTCLDGMVPQGLPAPPLTL